MHKNVSSRPDEYWYFQQFLHMLLYNKLCNHILYKFAWKSCIFIGLQEGDILVYHPAEGVTICLSVTPSINIRNNHIYIYHNDVFFNISLRYAFQIFLLLIFNYDMQTVYRIKYKNKNKFKNKFRRTADYFAQTK